MDFQIYLLCFPLIVALIKKPKLGLLLCFAYIALGMLWSGLIASKLFPKSSFLELTPNVM